MPFCVSVFKTSKRSITPLLASMVRTISFSSLVRRALEQKMLSFTIRSNRTETSRGALSLHSNAYLTRFPLSDTIESHALSNMVAAIFFVMSAIMYT